MSAGDENVDRELGFVERMIAAGKISPEAERFDDGPETTMAEEPIEDRLQRAWLNGFREGVERANRGYPWDHS